MVVMPAQSVAASSDANHLSWTGCIAVGKARCLTQRNRHGTLRPYVNTWCAAHLCLKGLTPSLSPRKYFTQVSNGIHSKPCRCLHPPQPRFWFTLRRSKREPRDEMVSLLSRLSHKVPTCFRAWCYCACWFSVACLVHPEDVEAAVHTAKGGVCDDPPC